MEITLTSTEVAMLTDAREGVETVEDALHRILAPQVAAHGEARLTRLSDEYRKLSPEDQLEALELLRVWQVSKAEAR